MQLNWRVVMALCCLWPFRALADKVGEVSTVFHMLGANDKIIIEAFDDPAVPGVTCYLSRATKGGVSGSLGLAEDPSDASISCHQTAAITVSEELVKGKRNGEEVFQADTSLLFKTLQVVRYYDKKRNTLVYLSYSDKIVEGSPKNSVSAVAIRPWGS